MGIENIVFTLADRFIEYDWDIELIEPQNIYCIIVNDYNFYQSKELKKWNKILRVKYPKVRYITAYKKFKHESN